MQEMCQDIKDIDLDVTEKTFQTNIISMFAMSKYALKHMNRGDTIVNSASVASYMSNPTLLDYASTKGAIVTFTRGLAQQQAKNGIRVNAVAPGIMCVNYTSLNILNADYTIVGRLCNQQLITIRQRLWIL